jgi:hypothetical protein
VAKINCPDCNAGLHESCEFAEPISGGLYATCCCWTANVSETNSLGSLGSILSAANTETLSGEVPDLLSEQGDSEGRIYKDQLSTGRKRAARAKEMPDEGMVCEWAGLKFAGGGVKPIVGCGSTIIYKQRGRYARHHGPDKSTLNNGEGNLHLICVGCHNRWHSLNDSYYGVRPENGQPFIPLQHECLQHDAITMATAKDRYENEIFWQEHPAAMAKDE